MDTTVREAELGESAEACKARTNCYCPTCGDIYINGEDSCAKDQTALVPCEEVDPLIGEVIASTFKLIRPLARGAMGQLYEAEHVRLGRKFAVKVLHESFRERREAKIRFEREAAALAKIRSENVVAVIDATLTRDGRPAIVTEFLQGRDLSQRLVNNGKLEAKEALAIVRSVALGLVAAHRVGVVHRDLKPSNIFLSEDDLGQISAKLVDFGVAKLEGESELTRSGVVLGTPAYMAPEQARESSNAAPQMDVYAVGAVLYRMLSGRPTYDSKEAAVVLRALLAGPPTPLREHCPSLPNEVLALVDKALARDPKNRFASALHLLEAVDLAAQACDGPGAQGKNVREPLALTRTRQNTTLASLSNVGQQLTCFLSTFAQTAWSFVRHAVTIMKPRLAALQRTSALALGRVGVRVRATRQRTANAWRTFVADRTKTENKPPRRTTSTTIVQGPQSQSRDARAELQRSRAKKQAA